MQAVATNNYLLKGSYSASLRSSSDTFRFCLLCLSCLVISNQIKPKQNNQNNHVQNYYCMFMLIIKKFFYIRYHVTRSSPTLRLEHPGAAKKLPCDIFSTREYKLKLAALWIRQVMPFTGLIPGLIPPFNQFVTCYYNTGKMQLPCDIINTV